MTSPSRGRRLRAGALLGLAALTLTSAGAPVAALATSGSGVGWGDADPGKLVLVLDSSGSMREATGSGEPRIDAAKKALGQVIDALPANQEVGMRVYGSTIEAADPPPPGACTDSKLVVPIATDNRDALTNEVAKYKPFGETPIAYSLGEAGKDLGSEGKRQIVLVSDGEESCEPDPCPVAGQLAADGIDLTINVVGLNVTGKARDDLQCIANSGKGQYFDANDADSLAKAIQQAAMRTAEGFVPSGTPVKGSLDETKPTELAAGTPEKPAKYVDQLADADDKLLYYRVPRTIQDSTIWFNATGSVMESKILGRPQFKVTNVKYSSDCILEYSGFFTSLTRVFSEGFLLPGDSYVDENCATGNEVIIGVDPHNVPGTQVELTVIEEPPVENLDGLPDPIRPGWEPVSAGDPQSAPWATTTANAKPVEPGAYNVEQVGGEMRFVAVDLDWGQGIQVTLSKEERTKFQGLAVVIPPTGGQAAYRPEAKLWGGTVQTLSAGANPAEMTTTAVAYSNRYVDDDKSAYLPISMPGRYLVGVMTTADDNRGRMEVRNAVLQIDVVGEPVEGPEYVSKPIAGAASTTPSQSAEPSAAPSTPPTKADEQQGPPWIPIALGAGVVLLVVAAAAAFWIKTRRRGNNQTSADAQPGPPASGG